MLVLYGLISYFQDEDPFVESLDTEVIIGKAYVNLKPLAYHIELKESLEILNYKGYSVGLMEVRSYV